MRDRFLLVVVLGIVALIALLYGVTHLATAIENAPYEHPYIVAALIDLARLAAEIAPAFICGYLLSASPFLAGASIGFAGSVILFAMSFPMDELPRMAMSPSDSGSDVVVYFSLLAAVKMAVYAGAGAYISVLRGTSNNSLKVDAEDGPAPYPNSNRRAP